MLAQQFGHGAAEVQAVAEVAAGHAGQPAAVLHQDGIVEAVQLGQARGVGGAAFAGQPRRRIAGGEDQREADQRHEHHQQRGHQQAAEQECNHGSTFVGERRRPPPGREGAGKGNRAGAAGNPDQFQEAL